MPAFGGMMGMMGGLRPRGPPGRPMPFAHHYGDPMGVQEEMRAGHQALVELADEYAYLSIDSIKQWLCDYTVTEIIQSLT